MNITLIGMPGVGKSFIGKKLALKLGYKFVDVDDLIEKNMNVNLQKVLDNLGDSKFIEMEEEMILGLKLEKTVISPGGSVVYSKKAMNFLKKNSQIIYLKDELMRIKRRIPNLDSRGIVGLGGKSFEALFMERERLYEKYADFSVFVGDFDDKRIVEEDIEKVEINK